MPQYNYTGLSNDGLQIAGILAAPSREAAVVALRQQGTKPLHVAEAKIKKKIGFSFGNKVSIKDLTVFTREFSTMIDAGVPLPRGLETLSQQADNKYFKKIIEGIHHDIESGMQLADAMSKYPDVFSEVYVNMIRAGEAGGILDDIMKRLATQVEKDAAIRHKIKSAMAYPMVILVITVVAFFGIMLFIMPKISTIIASLAGPNAKLPIYSQVMMDMSHFVKDNIFYIVIIGTLICWGFMHYINTDKGKYWWHGLLLKMPIFGKVMSKIIVARFSRTFASLMGSGVTVLMALDVTGKAVGNHVIKKELEDVAQAVKNGQPLGKQLMQVKYFPPIVGQMMSVGEETGKIDEILVKVADFYEEEVDSVIDGLASIIEPIMIVILGGLVGLIAASVMGPIAGLSKQIGN
jgi:type IV pilus assembly protein PilC